MEQEISEKKGQPREVDQNVRNEFPETFCSIRFWTKISRIFFEWNAPRVTDAIAFPDDIICKIVEMYSFSQA